MLEVGIGLVTSPQNRLPSNCTQQGRFLQMGSLQTRGAGHTASAERAGRAGENRLDHSLVQIAVTAPQARGGLSSRHAAPTAGSAQNRTQLPRGESFGQSLLRFSLKDGNRNPTCLLVIKQGTLPFDTEVHPPRKDLVKKETRHQQRQNRNTAFRKHDITP